MQLTGTIQSAQPAHFADDWGNQWQRIILATPQGNYEGLIGSKNGYEGRIDQPLMVEATNLKDKNNKPYLKFKRIDPEQQGGQQGGQQGPQQAAQSKDNKNRGFAMSYTKDLVCAGKWDVGALETLANLILKWLDGNAHKPQNVAEVVKQLPQDVPAIQGNSTGFVSNNNAPPIDEEDIPF